MRALNVNRLTRMALVVSLPMALGACGVNKIPTLEANAKTKFADLQADYQRRADLIPNLVATVKGYAGQEKSVLVEVTQARASATQIHVDPQTTTSDPAAMRYPDLKSNENFLALQSQLEGTENRITIARRDYNAAVQDYNLSLVTFPSILWAKSIYSAEKPMIQFQASDAAQNAPTVSFDSVAPSPPAAAPANSSGQ
jgi:LemA protein